MILTPGTCSPQSGDCPLARQVHKRPLTSGEGLQMVKGGGSSPIDASWSLGPGPLGAGPSRREVCAPCVDGVLSRADGKSLAYASLLSKGTIPERWVGFKVRPVLQVGLLLMPTGPGLISGRTNWDRSKGPVDHPTQGLRWARHERRWDSLAAAAVIRGLVADQVAGGYNTAPMVALGRVRSSTR